MDYSIFWTGIQNLLKQEIPDMFLTQLQYSSFNEENKKLILVTPNEFLKDFIFSNYKDTIEIILLQCWNQKITVDILISNNYQTEKPKKIKEESKVNSEIEIIEDKQPEKNEAKKEKTVLIIENKQPSDKTFSDSEDECTFDSFLTDDTNEYAFRLAQTIAEEPGNPKRNPLFLWGESGTGKTHLIKAIKQRAEKLFCEKKIIYVTSESFLNEFLDSIHNRSKDSEQDKPKIFREKYRNLDILLLDDFQALSGKTACLNELFNTFNELYDHKTQMVITCDQPISKVKDVEKRIKSRFSMGTTVELKQPDYELKMAILKELAQQNEMEINIKNIEYICTNISGNIREIKGAFRDLLAYTSIMNIKEITNDVINKCLKDKITAVKSVGNISIDKIMEIVAVYYDLTVLDIRGKKRTQSIAIARQIAMYLSTQYTRLSTTQIGKYFNKEHATIIHAATKIKKSMEEDKKLKSEIINIENRIKESI